VAQACISWQKFPSAFRVSAGHLDTQWIVPDHLRPCTNHMCTSFSNDSDKNFKVPCDVTSWGRLFVPFLGDPICQECRT
jgi:hypothetical protein